MRPAPLPPGVVRETTEAVTGAHEHVVHGFSNARDWPPGARISSAPFAVGGHTWRLDVYPGGYDARCAGHVSCCLELACACGGARGDAGGAACAPDCGAQQPPADVFARYEVALCDAAPRGEPPRHALAAVDADAPPPAVRRGRLARVRRLASWRHLTHGRPSLLHDDVAVFRATVQVVRTWCDAPAAAHRCFAALAAAPPQLPPTRLPPRAAPTLPMSCSETRVPPPPAPRRRHKHHQKSNVERMDQDGGGDWSDDGGGEGPASGADVDSAEEGGNGRGARGALEDEAAAAVAASVADALRAVEQAAGRRRAAVDALRIALYTSAVPPPPPAPALRSLLRAVRSSPRDAELGACGCAALRALCAAPAWDAPACRAASDAALASGAMPALAALLTWQSADTEVQTEACLAMGTLALARLTGMGTAAAASAARGGLALFAAGALERLRAGDADAAAAAAADGCGGALGARPGPHARRAAAAAAEAHALQAAQDAAVASGTAPAGATSAAASSAHAALDALAAARGLVAARQRIASELLLGLQRPAASAAVEGSA